jgi:hypothetical protein
LFVVAKFRGMDLRSNQVPSEQQREHHGEAWLYELIAAAVSGQIDVATAA